MNAPAPAQETLIGHLLELRSRLMKAVFAVCLVFLALLPLANPLYTWMAEPLFRNLPENGQLVAIDVMSPFFTPMKLAFFVALAIAMPMVLYQAWAFVAPGLYQNEKRLARPLLLAATLLFYVGVAFAYYVLLPAMFAFLSGTGPTGVVPMTDIAKYLDFILVIFVASGFAFEVPVAVMIAAIMGWVTPAQLGEWRGYVIVAIFIVAAVITPPDGLSMVLLAVPMCLLYEVGIVFARVLARRRAALPAG